MQILINITDVRPDKLKYIRLTFPDEIPYNGRETIRARRPNLNSHFLTVAEINVILQDCCRDQSFYMGICMQYRDVPAEKRKRNRPLRPRCFQALLC